VEWTPLRREQLYSSSTRQSTMNEGWTTSEVEGQLLEPMWCPGAVHEGGHHKYNREAPLEQKALCCACRLLRTSNLKEGAM
jgi:hypothetical protein